MQNRRLSEQLKDPVSNEKALEVPEFIEQVGKQIVPVTPRDKTLLPPPPVATSYESPSIAF